VWAASIGAVLLQAEAGWREHIPILLRKSVLYGAIVAAFAFAVWRTWNTPNVARRRPA